MYILQKFIANNLDHILKTQRDPIPNDDSFYKPSSNTFAINIGDGTPSSSNNPIINANLPSNNNNYSRNNTLSKKVYSKIIDIIDPSTVTNNTLLERQNNTDKALSNYLLQKYKDSQANKNNSTSSIPGPLPYPPSKPPSHLPINTEPYVVPIKEKPIVKPNAKPNAKPNLNPVSTTKTTTESNPYIPSTPSVIEDPENNNAVKPENKPPTSSNFTGQGVSSTERQDLYHDLPEFMKRAEVPNWFLPNLHVLTTTTDRLKALNKAADDYDKYMTNYNKLEDEEYNKINNTYIDAETNYNQITESEITLNNKRAQYEEELYKNDPKKLQQIKDDLKSKNDKIYNDQKEYKAWIDQHRNDWLNKLKDKFASVQDQYNKKKAFIGELKNEIAPNLKAFERETTANSITYATDQKAADLANKIVEERYNTNDVDEERWSNLLKATADFNKYVDSSKDFNSGTTDSTDIQFNDQIASYRELHKVVNDNTKSETEKAVMIDQLRDTILASSAIHSYNQNYVNDMINLNKSNISDHVEYNISRELIKLKHDYLLPENVRSSYTSYLENFRNQYRKDLNSVKLNPDIDVQKAPKIYDLERLKIQVSHDMTLKETEKRDKLNSIDAQLNELQTSHADNLLNNKPTTLNDIKSSLNSSLSNISNSLKNNANSIHQSITGSTSSSPSNDKPSNRNLQQRNLTQISDLIGANKYNTYETIPYEPELKKDSYLNNKYDDDLKTDISNAINILNKNANEYKAINNNYSPKQLVEEKDNNHVRNIPYYNENRQSLVEPILNTKRRAEVLLESNKVKMSNKRRQNDFYYNSPYIMDYIHLKN